MGLVRAADTRPGWHRTALAAHERELNFLLDQAGVGTRVVRKSRTVSISLEPAQAEALAAVLREALEARVR